MKQGGFSNIGLLILGIVALAGILSYFEWSQQPSDSGHNTYPPVVSTGTQPATNTRQQALASSNYTNQYFRFQLEAPSGYAIKDDPVSHKVDIKDTSAYEGATDLQIMEVLMSTSSLSALQRDVDKTIAGASGITSKIGPVGQFQGVIVEGQRAGIDSSPFIMDYLLLNGRAVYFGGPANTTIQDMLASLKPLNS